jgi:hypothetical protein
MLPAGLCLIACLIFPVLYFQGRIAPATYKSALSAATVGYFVCAAMLAARGKR